MTVDKVVYIFTNKLVVNFYEVQSGLQGEVVTLCHNFNLTNIYIK